jgi:hypothetical protein
MVIQANDAGNPIDAYRDRAFRREIDRIGQALAARFALQPDPSGNFSKMRLPLGKPPTDEDRAPRSGMLVEVCIDVRNR